MNRLLILFVIAFLNAIFSALSGFGEDQAVSAPLGVRSDPGALDQPPSPESASAKREALSRKVVRMSLNQNEPAQIEVGLDGITTLEFPGKIEALNGYGFALQPNLNTDEFQLTFEKGTNFLSLKALRPGVSANLTVVINGKVYCLFCEQNNDPSFVVIFGAPGETPRTVARDNEKSARADKKQVSREDLVGFMEKVKNYSKLKAGLPDSIATLNIAEPNKTSEIGAIETLIKRVLRDGSLGLLGFEVQLTNRGQLDYYLDPEGFAVRVGDVQFDQALSDCGGIVPAGTSVPAFFVVNMTMNGGPTDLPVDQNFDVQIRAGTPAGNSSLTENFVEPPQNYLPGGTPSSKENAAKVRHTQKEDPKESKETHKHSSAQVNAKDHGGKTGEPVTKKHWYDLFRRNPPSVE